MPREVWILIQKIIDERIDKYPDSESYRESVGYIKGHGR